MGGLRSLDLLRRVDSRAYRAERATQRWSAQGFKACLGKPAADQMYLSFVAQGHHGAWQGALASQGWLSAILPQLPELLSGECPDSRVLQLFETVAQPVEIAARELHYHSIMSVQLVPGCDLQDRLLAGLKTPEGTLWLTDDVPTCRSGPTSLPAWASGLPMQLRMIMGVGYMPGGQLAHLAIGDVLIIDERTQHLYMAERCIGRFDLTEEGFRMEFNPAELPLPTSAEDLPPAVPQIPTQALELLPIRLEFVLQEWVCNLGDLANIQADQVLPLQPLVQNNIEIRANGRTIAVGELVRWESGLGVQLHTLVRGAGE